ncbi:MAG: hypothetical protein GMKNLPBB_01692 [Myxococcota bacterium]|nr:hypothetical protein [Myxococcota bacterium]
MAGENKLYGVLAEFESPKDLLHACEKVREAGYQKWDAYSPFPVHGIEAAMGQKPSPLGWMSFIGAITGASLGMLMQWWMSAVDYPLVISGKPLFSWPAFIPITFELGVLFGALTAFLGMLLLNGLPRPYNPLFSSERFARVTDDRFFIAIEAADPKFRTAEAKDLLTKLGATHVELVEGQA